MWKMECLKKHPQKPHTAYANVAKAYKINIILQKKNHLADSFLKGHDKSSELFRTVRELTHQAATLPAILQSQELCNIADFFYNKIRYIRNTILYALGSVTDHTDSPKTPPMSNFRTLTLEGV